MTKLHSSPAAKAEWEALRTTPRGRGLVKMLVVNPGQVSPRRLPSAKRAAQRQQLHDLYLLRLRREAEIGTDPLYQNTYQRVTGLSQAWRKLAKAWDRAATAAQTAP